VFLSEAIEDFARYSLGVKGYARKTHITYQNRQRQFADWLAEHKHLPDIQVHDITPELLREFVYHLSGPQGRRDGAPPSGRRGSSAPRLRPRTIRAVMHAVRALFFYLAKIGVIDPKENPAPEVELPKMDAATRLLVSDEDLMRLLEATDRLHSEFRRVRDRAILAVLIYCGVRRQELLDLRVADVNLEDRALLVQQGKGRRSRVLPLCQEAVPPLMEWLALRRTFTRCRHDALFVTDQHQRVGDNTLRHLLEEVKAIAGIRDDPRIKPHSIRHAAATRMLRNGADIKSIQAFLGHSLLQTTSIYLHGSEQQVRMVIETVGLARDAEGAADRREEKRSDQRAEFIQRRRATPAR
jgi:site-specific recombinase XerD